MSVDDLRQNHMMAHLLDALQRGEDIGHYGRLVFAMVAHHFMSPDELTSWLSKSSGAGEDEIRALVAQVEARNYNPPRREKILEWQRQQEFPILPSGDPDEGNVYKDLHFPDAVYQHIIEYYEDKAEG